MSFKGVLCVLVTGGIVACGAVLVMAGDGTPGLHALTGSELAAARQAKAAHAAQPHQKKAPVKLDHPVKLKETKARATGTIQYDNGSFTSYGTTAGNSYGNHFNIAMNTAGTATTPVQASGSVTHVTFGVQGVDGATTWGPMYITLYDQLNTTAATANYVTSGGFSWGGGPHTGPAILNGAIGPWNYAGSTFLLGMYDYNTNATTPTNIAPLLGTGTTHSLGNHGFSMAYHSSGGTAYTTLDANAVMRATGNVIVPVELMDFNIE